MAGTIAISDKAYFTGAGKQFRLVLEWKKGADLHLGDGREGVMGLYANIFSWGFDHWKTQ